MRLSAQRAVKDSFYSHKMSF